MEKKELNFFKENENDEMWWVDDGSLSGPMVSFDKKKVFHLYSDYPEKFTQKQIRIFQKECPYWAEYFQNKMPVKECDEEMLIDESIKRVKISCWNNMVFWMEDRETREFGQDIAINYGGTVSIKRKNINNVVLSTEKIKLPRDVISGIFAEFEKAFKNGYEQEDVALDSGEWKTEIFFNNGSSVRFVGDSCFPNEALANLTRYIKDAIGVEDLFLFDIRLDDEDYE